MTTAIVEVGTREVSAQKFFNGDLLNRWLSFAGVSEKSASTYKTALRQLSKYFAANVITMPTREDLEAWRDSLIEAGKSPSTIALYLTSAKLLFRWLAQEGIYANIGDHLKNRVRLNHEHKKDALTPRQAAVLLKNIGVNTLKGKRDRVCVGLMASCGLRCVEVSRLNVADMIHEFGRTYLLIQGKGHSSKDAKVLLPAQVEALIRDYLQARHADVADAMFVSHSNRNRGARISTQIISRMVKANLRGVGLDSKRLTAHSLRHTAATTMLLAGVALTDVQQVLRHVSISTTQIYNHSVERMRNVAEQTAADAIFDSLSA